MEQVAFIVWRESIEALLVVGILFTWLRASPEGRRGLPWLWSGVAAGLLLAGALGLALLGLASWLSDTGQEWFQAVMALAACKGGKPAGSNFPDHAGLLAQVVLMGNIALRPELKQEKYLGTKLLWDADKFEFSNVPEANKYLTKNYREGWAL